VLSHFQFKQPRNQNVRFWFCRLELYQFAAEEYERLLYQDASNLVFLKRLIQCYKKTGDSNRITSRLAKQDINDTAVLQEYYDLLLLNNNLESFTQSFNSKRSLFDLEQQLNLDYKLAIGHRDWNQVKALKQKNPDHIKHDKIIALINNSKYKNPTLAATMSAIVPGAGRFYAKDAKDGIISLVIVGASAYQSYRRFDQKGIKSVSAWIFGGISLGFYLSNIYGSYQSAKFYNKKLDDKIYQYALPTILYSTN